MTGMAALAVVDERTQLAQLVNQTVTTHQPCVITRHGRRAAVLLSAAEYDMLQERITVLSDPTLRATDPAGMADVDALDQLSVDQLADVMRRAGLLPC
jgi:antitoxin YefM